MLRAASGLAITANVGRAWRAPDLFEMFTNGPRLGEARYEIGDADMNEETSLNLDRSVRIDLSRFRGEIAAYRNRIDNHIFVTPTAELRNGLRVFRYGQSNATLVGGEASAEAIAARALTVRGRYDVVKATNDETDEPLALIPARSGAIGPSCIAIRWAGPSRPASGSRPRLSPTRRASPSPKSLRQATRCSTSRPAPSTRGGARRLRIDLRLHNAFDKNYRSFLNRYKEFASDPGRNLMIRVSTDI